MMISQQTSPELDTLVVATEILTGRLPFLEKCGSVLAVLGDFTNSEFVALHEFDPDNSTLNLVAYYNRSPLPESTHIPLPMRPTSLPAKALLHESPIVVDDYTSLEFAHKGYLDAGIRSALSIPVQVDGKSVATLGFGSKLFNHYEEETVRLLVGIAAVIGMIMAKAELHDLNEVEASVGRIVSSPLVGPDVFERFSAEASRIIDYDHLSLNSVDIPEGTFITDFLIGEEVPHVRIGKVRQIGSRPLGIVARTQNSQIFSMDDRDGAEPKFPSAELFVAAGLPYLISVPLIVGDQLIGTMGFIRGSRPFSRKDLAKADRLGKLIAGAFADYKSEAFKKAAEIELRESEERFRQLAENMRGVFWLFDITQKRMLYVGPNAEDVWGYSAEQFYNDYLGWIELVHPEDREQVLTAVEKRQVTGEIDVEFRVVRSDGTIRWVWSRGFSVKDEEGNLYRLAGIAEDVTEQKSTMQRMAESSHLASIGELSAGVAHEINNPLTAIILNADLSLEADPPEPYRESFRTILEQGQRAAKIVKNLLAFARRSNTVKGESNLSDLVLLVLEIKEQEFRLNNIRTVVDVARELPLVSVDAFLMIQVMTNILTNAVQACAGAHGGGVLTVTGAVVSGNVRISVSDDGPGIPADDLAKIFEPFFTTKEVGVGTGLGLSISHGIITQHEGRLWVESVAGTGATFHIELPVLKDQGSDGMKVT